jgi:hypothetical protein
MQTIKKCNEMRTGTKYPAENIRTAASIEQLCEYVDAGHPIASCEGNTVRLLRINVCEYVDYDEYE